MRIATLIALIALGLASQATAGPSRQTCHAHGSVWHCH